MTIGVVATLQVQAGKEAEFEVTMKELVSAVHAHEPDTLFYELHKSRTEAGVYKVLEQYRSEDAMKAHGQTEYFLKHSKVLGGLLAQAPNIEVLDAL